VHPGALTKFARNGMRSNELRTAHRAGGDVSGRLDGGDAPAMRNGIAPDARERKVSLRLLGSPLKPGLACYEPS
jgi:hypothetical protein